jgi:hypothetical protein
MARTDGEGKNPSRIPACTARDGSSRRATVDDVQGDSFMPNRHTEIKLHLAAAGQLIAKGEPIVEALGGERMNARPIEHAVLVRNQIAES